jgi:hypothetical protein
LLALRTVRDTDRDEIRQMYAAIQATLHNAWLRPKGKRAYKAEDFLGKKKTQTWQEKKDILRNLLTIASTHLPVVEPPPRAKGH